MAFHTAFHAADKPAETTFHVVAIAVMNADHATCNAAQIALAAVDMAFHTAFHAAERAADTTVHVVAMAVMNADHAT
jgi:hypothetical protein